MKARRHFAIMELISQERMETQAELTDALQERGYPVTQATVSRDIKDLGLIKIPDSQGYHYALPDTTSLHSSSERLKRAFQDSVLRCDSSENIIMIKTLPGAAQSIASRVDGMNHALILGSVAGDDTVLIVVKPKSAVDEVLNVFTNLLYGP